jgi:pyrroloquinoline quinone biosynthesis protein B
MHLRILGSAAGGGFPQWNCACRNCRAVRAGSFQGKARTQAQVAVSGNGRSWFLLGGSPDLRQQIEATPALQPSEGVRQSPIAGVVLASVDLDHVLGLLLLRELQPLRIYGTPSVLGILREDNSVFGMLNRVPEQAVWTEILPGQKFRIENAHGSDSGLSCTAISLGSHYPPYVANQGFANPESSNHGSSNQRSLVPNEASLGLIVESASGVRLAYMPAVPTIDDALLELLESVSVVMFDGTFWSEDELIRIQGGGQTAGEMGHIPVGSVGGSLQKLHELRRPRRIYLHINNTNPMLDESGPEFRAVRDAGWEIAEDGWELKL